MQIGTLQHCAKTEKKSPWLHGTMTSDLMGFDFLFEDIDFHV